MAISTPRRDPRDLTEAGAYMTDGVRLVEILELDHAGALAEDVRTEELVSIEAIDLMQRWRRVRPLEEDGP